MIKCPVCGTQGLDEHDYCSKCGSSLTGATGQLAPSSLLEERYVIDSALGRGGMGAVYLAHDQRLKNMPVAVKEMSTNSVRQGNLEAAIEAFKQEAETLSKLNHPALPRITDFFSQGDTQWYLVMDYIEGETLEEIVLRRGTIPETEVLDWANQLCEVLDYLHGQQPPVIFRDLKPSNIMLTPEGKIKLIDFGIARHFKPESKTDTVAYGSFGFAPPEQYGKRQTDARSDIFALGATLHYLLTGLNPCEKPFIFESPGSNVSISPRLESAIMNALELKPENRPASAKEMLELLMVFCPKCKTVLNKTDAKFCSHCGASILLADQDTSVSSDTIILSKPVISPHDSVNPVPDEATTFLSLDNNKYQLIREFTKEKLKFVNKLIREKTKFVNKLIREKTKSVNDLIGEKIKSVNYPNINKLLPHSFLIAALVVFVFSCLLGYALMSSSNQEDAMSSKESNKSLSSTTNSEEKKNIKENSNIPNKKEDEKNNEKEDEEVDEKADEKQIENLLEEWVISFRDQDISDHMECYADNLERYFNNSNESKDTVYKNKETMMGIYDSIKMDIDNLEINMEDNDSAVATFNKKWDASGAESFSGEELQRLKLEKINGSWKITSEEEVKIYWVIKNGKKIM